MKFLFIFFSLINLYFSQDIPYFISFPSGPISNYTQSSILVLLRCNTQIFLNNNNVFVSLQDFAQDFDQWFSQNNPITLTTNTNDLIKPQLLSFTNFDLTLSFTTSQIYNQFTLLISENKFYSYNHISVPYSSPLIITRINNNYITFNIMNNPLQINQYNKNYIKSWEDKDISNSIINDLSSVRYYDGLPFLDIIISISESGKGGFNINPTLNIAGYKYDLDEMFISIIKKDPIYHLPISFIGSIPIVQEETSKNQITNFPFESSSRLEFYSDIIKVQSGELVCIEQSTLFKNFTISDFSQLEKNDFLDFQLRVFNALEIIFVEYKWNKHDGWQRTYPYLVKGYPCKLFDLRNQFCPYCSEVYHRMTKTNYSYYSYSSNGMADLVDFGLSVSLLNSSFYFKNSNENNLQNSQISINFSLQNIYNIGSNFILIPQNNFDSSYYIWIQDIVSGCSGINISYSDFYQSTCQMQQYSCSNIHYFRDPQNETLLMNKKYNYNYGNKRSGIMYNKDSLTFEIPQTRMSLNISVYIPNLPFLQPFIKEKSFYSRIDPFYIYVIYTFINYGKKEGAFRIDITCNGTSNSLSQSNVINPDEILEYSFSFPKSIIFRENRIYSCMATVSIDTLNFWSKTDKQIQSIKYFVLDDSISTCKSIPNDSILVSKQFLKQPIEKKITFIFNIENQIKSIDWFVFNVSCSNNNIQSRIMQIPYTFSLKIPVTIKLFSNPKCRITIESYDQICNYTLYADYWDYVEEINKSNLSTSLKAVPFSIILILTIIMLI